MLIVYEPYYIALGATCDLGGQADRAIGLQGELTHLWSGLWGQLGWSLTRHSESMLSLSAGWSLIGIEFQQVYFASEGHPWALLGKIRIPIGILFFGLTETGW